MNQIKMVVSGKTETFQIVYRCKEYMFLECPLQPALRGFYTASFTDKNIVA